jgi:predicted DNA-binding transcriptional regulator YafY
MDRINKLETSGRKFKMPKNFNVDELFSTSFGIYLPENKARTITFRTSETEARFLRDLPLHRSQQETGRDDDYVTFSIFVCPDRNLTMEFCKYGSRIEVLSPADVREDVAEELRKAAEKYR